MSKNKPSNETVSSIDDDVEAVDSDVLLADTPDAGPAIAGNHHGFSGVKVRLVINESDGDSGKEAVFASLNEYSCQIPRNTEVLLPIEVFKTCIEGARMNVISRTAAGMVERAVNRFSYSMLGTVGA